LAIATLVAACSGANLGVGETCASDDECADGLQCLDSVCTPRCSAHIECGDGYRCLDSGECEQVISEIGDFCAAEIECGPEQTCALEPSDADGDGTVFGRCQAQPIGKVAGTTCRIGAECQTGLCMIGVCTQLCRLASDCAPGATCAEMPASALAGEPHFTGCLPATGVLSMSVPNSATRATLPVVVPSNVRSFALITRIGEADQQVGAIRLTAPDGRTHYVNPVTPDDFYANAIRYKPGTRISTLMVPNTPAVALQVGTYLVEVSSLLPVGGVGTAAPQIELFYKLDSAATLDLHFYFLDLAEHPCAVEMGETLLNAASAPTSVPFAGFLTETESILSRAGLTFGDIAYRDITGRGDLDGLQRSNLGDLLSLAEHTSGINVFLVRSIGPTGIQALIGGTPGPPRTAGTTSSGMAVGLDTLCYRSWNTLARVVSQSIVRQMGLFPNRDSDGQADTIPDTDGSTDNLLFFGEFGGSELTSGQVDVIRRYPGLR